MAEELPLCAGCGRIIRPDYWEPQLTSLFAECEAFTQKNTTNWEPKNQAQAKPKGARND